MSNSLGEYMSFKNVIIGGVIILAFSITFSADSTTKSISPKPEISTNSPVIATKTDIKNQKKITRPNTTWSKIKDLFM